MLKRFIKIVGGDPNKREINKYSTIVEQINSLETKFEKLNNQELSAKTDEFINRLNQGETLDDLLVEAFATVREASKRTIGLRHYDVQLIGGITLHEGKIAEMRTGEGKTLVATLAIYLNPELSYYHVEFANYYLKKGKTDLSNKAIEFCKNFEYARPFCQEYDPNKIEDIGFLHSLVETYLLKFL